MNACCMYVKLNKEDIIEMTTMMLLFMFVMYV